MNNDLVLVFSMFIFSHPVLGVRITMTPLCVCVFACVLAPECIKKREERER